MYIVVFFMFFLLIMILLFWTNIKKMKKYKEEEKPVSVPLETTEEFEEIFNKMNNIEIEDLERKRQELLKCQHKSMIFLILPLTLLILLFTFPFQVGMMLSLPMKIVIVILGIISLILAIPNIKKVALLSKEYRQEYKGTIIANFIHLFNSNLQYIPNEENFMTEAYDKSGLEREIRERYCEQNYIEGRINDNVKMQMAEVKTTITVNTDNGTSERTLFNGMFVETNCDNIKSSIMIMGNADSSKKTEMDSSEFEECFDVFSDDRILAMRILTHDVMSMLSDFYKKIKFEIAIKNDRIYIRFFTGVMFEPKFKNNTLDRELLFKYYYILKFVMEVTAKINKEIQNLII